MSKSLQQERLSYIEELKKKREEEEKKNKKSSDPIKSLTGERETFINRSKEENVGGFWGGVGYLGQSFLNGAVRGVEGVVDYTVGGIASIFGADEYAEKLMTEDWYNYNAAAEKYNPGSVMGTVGDVFGGVGQGALSIGVGALASWLSQGTLAPAAIAAIGAGFSGVSAAGTAVSEAAKDPNADDQGLDYKDWLYGTGVGALEAGIEYGTGKIGNVAGNVFGKTSGEIGSELFEAITKKGVSNTVTSSVGKEILQEMAGEGLEEGLSTFLEPYIKQATYDKDAESASFGDITYSALVGALAGGATIGPIKGLETGISIKRGADIAKDEKKTADLFKNAEIISSYERERQTGSEVFEAVSKQYEKVKKSLESTGGVAKTATQQAMLGELDRYVAAAAMQPALVNAARGVALNAEAYAESLNAFYAKTKSGKTVTAADLTAGLKLDGSAKQFVKSVNKAMRTNSVLREVVVNNTLGRMELDAAAYADSIYGNTRISAIASQENINRFVENADPETIESLGRALGIDMRTATSETLAAAIKQFRDSGNAALYEEGYNDIKAARGTEKFIEGLPSANNISEGVTRYKSGDTDIAVIKRGDTYRIYDYGSKKITRVLSRSELLTVLRELRGEGASALEVVGRLVEGGDTSSVGDADTFPSSGRLGKAEIESLAEEKIPEYKGLVETEREAVRETLRRAMLNGVSEEDAVLFGRIAAKSGMHIVVNTSGRDVEARADTSSTADAVPLPQQGRLNDAWYDGKNTVYVNADADRSRTFSGLLGHEMWHRMFKAKKAKKLFMKAYGNMPAEEKQEIIDQYKDDSKKRGLSVSDSVNIAKEEVAAAYAEEIFNSPDVWEFVLSEEQSLKDRVLKFFRGANKKYSFEPGMTKAAKKWLNEYKKLFNEVAAYNKGRSAAENAVASDKVRKIERVGRIVESVEGDDGSRKALRGKAEDGKKIYESNFPQGTPKAAKSERILNYIKNVWSKKPISLVISNGETSRTILAQFDPTIDESQNTPTDASKLAGGNRHGTSSEKRVTLDLADDYYEIASESKYNYSKQEIGKTTGPHKDVKMWHYFVNDIYFAEYGEEEYTPYTVSINVKEKADGNFVYSFNAEKESSTRRTLHAGVNTRKGANGELFIDSIPDSEKKSNSFDKKTSKDFKNGAENGKNVDDGSRSALKKVGASNSEVAAVKKKLTAKGVDPRGVAAVADYFFDTYGGALTRNAMRYRFMEAADVMTVWDSESFDRAYAKIEAIAEEIVNHPRDIGGQMEEIRALKAHLQTIRFAVHDADKGDFDAYGGYGEFRKRHMGKLTLANDGVEVDAIYAEMQNQYGLSWFPEVNTVSEQLMRMAQISDMDEDAIFGSVENVEAEAQAVTQSIVEKMVAALQAEQAVKEKRMSKSQNEAFKKRTRAKAEVYAAKAIARAQKRLDAEAAKLRTRAETADARAEAKYERATETTKAKLEAEYQTDTTFSEASVKKSFDSVEAISKLKKAKREEIARELWLELQMSDEQAVRDTFVLKYSVKLYDEIRRADYDAYDNMTYGERDALKGELEAMMKKLVKSGRASLRSKMEGDIEDRARLEGEVRSSKLSEIYQSLKKIDDVKRERFLAASGYKSEEFKKTLEALTRIDWRGKFSDNVARGEVKKLLSWYTPENPMFKGYKDGNETISSEFNEGIRIRLEMLSEGEGKLSNSELEALAEVIEYFSELVTNYDRVWLNNRWVSGEETVRGFLDIYNKQKEETLPLATRALRNKIMGQQTFGDPLSVMKLADLYEDGLFVTYYNEWQRAEIAAAAEEARILEEYNEFFSKKGNKDYLKRAMKDTIDLHGVEVRKIDYIEYVMTLKRKQAFEGVEYGGIVVTDKKGNSVKIYPLPMIDDGRGYSAKLEAAVDAEYKRAVKALSKADLEYMKILERGYELTRQAKAIGDVQRLGFVSVVEGYYYPIRRAYTEHLSEFDGAAAATDKFANAGFNKRTKKDSNSALRIGSADDTFHRHVHGISGYVHLSPVMDSFNKVYKLKVLNTEPGLGADVSALMKQRDQATSLQETIDQNKSTWKNKNGKSVGFEYLQEIMLDTMGKTPSGKGDDFTSWLRGGYVKFALGGNLKVLLTQLSSLAASTSVLSRRSHLYGVVAWGGKVDEYSVVAKLRHGDNTVLKAQGVVDNINAKTDFFMKGIELFDRIVVRRAFAACQAEVARTEGFKIGTEENLKAAGKLLDKVILETQQNSFASSKTGAARRGNAFVKTLQMFKSDAVKGAARVIDAMGEAAYIKKLLNNKDLSDTERKALKNRLKNANKNLRRSLSAVAMSSVYMVLIAELFRLFYGKNDEDEEKGDRWLRRGAEFIGNMLGGLPVYGELWNSFTSQFGDIEAMEFSAINDILDTAKKVIDYASDGLQGKNDGKDTANLLENLIYGVGQIFGVPVRNIKNFAYGVLRIVDKDAAYAFDSMFKDMSYAADLEDAIESGDDDLALTILELAMKEKLGSGLSDGAIRELARLAGLGESMLPSAVGDTVTIDGEERELSGSELKAVREIYGEAVERINVFVESAFYKSLNDKQKASAVRKIYTLYKDLGYDSVLGTERDKKAMMLSKLVSGDALVMWDACTVLEADKDEDGKTVSGSKKEKVIKAIWSLDIPDVQKLLLIGMRGYKFEDDDIPGVSGYAAQMALYSYIESLEGLTDEERLDLFEASGFEIKGGVAQEPTFKVPSTKKAVKVGTMKGTMVGSMVGSMIGKDYSKKIIKLGRIVNK